VLKVFCHESCLFALCLSVKDRLQTELLRLSSSKRQEVIFCHTGFPVYAFHKNHALFGFNKSLIAINISDEKPVWSQTRHPKQITSLAMREDEHVLVGDQDGVITEYTELNSRHRTLMHWHSGRVQALCCASHLFMSGGMESVLVYWHAPHQRDFLPRLGQEGGIVGIVLSPDEHYAAVSLSDNAIHLVNMHTNTPEHTLAGLKAMSGNVLTVEPTRNLILTDSELVGYLQLYDHALDTAFDDLHISPQHCISSSSSSTSASTTIQQAIYGHDSKHLWMVTAENGTEWHALRFWTLDSDNKYHLRTLIEDPHSDDIKTLCKASSASELMFVTASVNSFKLWAQVITPNRTDQDTRISWRCAFAGSHEGIESMDVCFWNGFTLLTLVDGSHLGVYEYFDGQVELACRVDIKRCVKCLFVRDHLVVFTGDKEMHVYAIKDEDDKLSLHFIHSMNMDMIDAAVSHEGVLAVLTIDHLCIITDVTLDAARNYPMIASRVCWLNAETVIAINNEHHLIKQQIQSHDINAHDHRTTIPSEHHLQKKIKKKKGRHEMGKDIATPINTIITAPVVSLTLSNEKKVLCDASSKRCRVRREEMCRERRMLRDSVPSHELASVDKLFDELIQG
jgi:hypothetical protein